MSELLEAGLTVTLFGMGVVFVLLTLLVGVIQAMSRLSRLLDGGAAVAPAMPAGAGPAPATDDEVISVIAGAIRMHRKKHGRS